MVTSSPCFRQTRISSGRVLIISRILGILVKSLGSIGRCTLIMICLLKVIPDKYYGTDLVSSNPAREQSFILVSDLGVRKKLTLLVLRFARCDSIELGIVPSGEHASLPLRIRFLSGR